MEALVEALVAALTLTFAGGADAGADHSGEDGGQFAMLRVGFHDAGSAAFRIGFTACTQRSFMITGRQVGHV